MGTLKYPGAPDFTYPDQMLANIQQIIAIQQSMGQGFWLERQGADAKLMGHDAIWIHPTSDIYIEFDGLDQVLAQQDVVDEWKMMLTVEGADRIVLRPNDAVMSVVRRDWGAE